MATLELKEYKEHSWSAPLDSTQLRALKDAHIGVAPSPDVDGGYDPHAVVLRRLR